MRKVSKWEGAQRQDSTTFVVLFKGEVAQSCARGGSDWTWETIYLPWEWSNTQTGVPSRWLVPHACQRSRGIWTMPSITCFNFLLALTLDTGTFCRPLPPLAISQRPWNPWGTRQSNWFQNDGYKWVFPVTVILTHRYFYNVYLLVLSPLPSLCES